MAKNKNDILNKLEKEDITEVRGIIDNMRIEHEKLITFSEKISNLKNSIKGSEKKINELRDAERKLISKLEKKYNIKITEFSQHLV